MVGTADSKERLLREEGYTYNFDRKVYLNRKAKKIFSVEFIEDHDENDLRKCIDEGADGAGWRFYFNSPPPKGVQREIENVLG
jgi:hypothetical protein